MVLNLKNSRKNQKKNFMGYPGTKSPFAGPKNFWVQSVSGTHFTFSITQYKFQEKNSEV